MSEIEGEYMTDKPREWPNLAKEVRDRAAEEAVHGIRICQDIIDDPDIEECWERMQFARALICFTNIARLLESVGAQTRP